MRASFLGTQPLGATDTDLRNGKAIPGREFGILFLNLS